jgi:hypothetical protein
VETKLAIAYESPQGWANFWSLSQALKDGKPFAGKGGPEGRADHTWRLECMHLLRLNTKSKEFRISRLRSLFRSPKLLELQKEIRG